ncbi:MAG: response regulator [Chloroflexi bacterium]|nr:response regulator [Chloroflexota bacterium]
MVVDTLFDHGYDVLESKDGKTAFEVACKELPDLILLDVSMPLMDGFAVLKKLRENTLTNAIPVVMLTAMLASEGEQDAMGLGVNHYISKPFDPDTLMVTVRVALREAGTKADHENGNTKVWGGATLFRSATEGEAPARIIPLGTQLTSLEKTLAGGFRLGTLSLIEGSGATGKSVICQYVASGALGEGFSVAYYTSQHTPRSLESQVSSIGMDWSDFIRSQQLVVYPVPPPITGQDSSSLFAELAVDMERAHGKHDVLIVDAITNLASSSQEQSIIGFFTTCKRLTSMGLTILLVTHSVAFNADLLTRAASLCETHLNLRTGKIREKVIRVVTVTKLDDVVLNKDNEVSFEIEAGRGISIIPYSSARA